MSLLWHAPRGKARQQPEIWGFLQKLVAESQDQPGKETPPENVPWEVYLGNFLALAKEPSDSGSSQPVINRARLVFSRDVRLNRLNSEGLGEPPFPVAKPGRIEETLARTDCGNFREH